MRAATRLLFLSLVAFGLSCGLDSKPAAPTDLKAAISAKGAIHLSWSDRSDNETGFVIERGPSAFEFAEQALLPAGAVVYDDYEINPSTTYFYRVRANNEAGLSLPSLVVRFDVPEAWALPAAPGNLAAASISGHDIRLTWSDNSNNETGFNVERATVAFGGAGASLAVWLSIATVGPNVKSFTDTDLIAGMTYSYRVAAVNSLGSSAFTEPVSASVPPDLSVPSAPTGLVATTGLDGVTLQWKDASKNELGFRVEHAIVEGRWMIAAETAANVTTVTFGGGMAATGWYRVCAYNTTGLSEYSNVATPGHPQLITVQVAPTGLGYTITPYGIELKWKDNSVYEAGYEIERSYFLGRFGRIATTGANVNRFVDEARFPHHRWYRVRAFNAYGVSEYSNTIEVGGLPALQPPAAPTALNATRLGSVIRLGWTDNANNELGFRIERNIAASKWVQVGFTHTNVTRFDDDAIPSHGPIFYRVCATNLAGDSAYTNSVIVYGN